MATSAATWIVYQPLIVGLGAVVLATIGNTALEWYRRHLHDAREARTLRRAFLEEMRVQRTMYAGAMSEDQRGETHGAFMIPIDTFMPVYENMIGKIGTLEPNEAAAILKAYSNIILVPKNLAIIGRIQRDEFSSFAVVPVAYADTLVAMNKTLVEVLDESIECLAGH